MRAFVLDFSALPSICTLGRAVGFCVLVIVAPLSQATAVTPVTTIGFGCGLRDASGIPVPGAFTDQPSGPVVASGTPTSPVVQEITASAVIPAAPPLAFEFSCSATAHTRGPVSEASIDFSGFAFNNQSFTSIASIEVVTGHFSVEALRSGGPASVPITVTVYQNTALFQTLGSNLRLSGASRFTAPQVPNMGGVASLPGKVPEDGITPGCFDPICERVTPLTGDAVVGTEYTYFLDASAFVTGLIFAPLPRAAAGTVRISTKAVVSIDPVLEFRPGRRYVDYFEVVHSDNVMPIGVARTIPPGVGPGDPYHLLFVTSQKREGTSPVIDHYNDFVNQVADDGGIGPNAFSVFGDPMQWYAVASTETVNARDNAVVTGAVYRIDGTLVAEDFFDLWDGDVLAPPDANELGLQLVPLDPMFPDTLVFTGTRGDGTGNQTSGQLGTVVSAAGRADLTDLGWINELGLSSITERRFYALSQLLVPEPGPGPSTLAALGMLAWLRARMRSRNTVHGGRGGS